MRTLASMVEEYLAVQAQRLPKDGNLRKAASEEKKRIEQELWSNIMAHPESFDGIRSFMVDVYGHLVKAESSDPDEQSKELMDLSDELADRGHEAISEFAGDLASQVRACMLRASEGDPGILLTDSGAGLDGWHFGCHCSEQGAMKLCRILHETFAVEIEKGVLAVERKQWSISWL